MGWTGHGRLLNSAALRALDLDREREAGFAGWIEQDGAGRPTGLFHGYEGFRIAAARTAPADDESSVAAFRAFAREALSYGITSVQQMAMPYSIEKSVAVLARAQVPLRWRLIDFPLEGVGAFAPAPAAPLPSNVSVSGVKWIADGTPEERWMAMREPFADRADWSGRPYLAAEDLRAAVAGTLARGEQVIVHAVGDRAVETSSRPWRRRSRRSGGASYGRASSTATACAGTSARAWRRSVSSWCRIRRTSRSPTWSIGGWAGAPRCAPSSSRCAR